MIFKSNKEKYFSKIEAIDLMVSLSATDANSEKKWRGFYNSLSQRELQGEWDENWKTERHKKWGENLCTPFYYRLISGIILIHFVD